MILYWVKVDCVSALSSLTPWDSVIKELTVSFVHLYVVDLILTPYSIVYLTLTHLRTICTAVLVYYLPLFAGFAFFLYQNGGSLVLGASFSSSYLSIMISSPDAAMERNVQAINQTTFRLFTCLKSTISSRFRQFLRAITY